MRLRFISRRRLEVDPQSANRGSSRHSKMKWASKVFLASAVVR